MVENISHDASLPTQLGHPMSKWIFLAGGAAAVLFFGLFLFSPPSAFPADSVFTVPEGASLRRTSRELKEENLIRSRMVFEAAVILMGGEKHIISGNYLFEDKLSALTIAKRISKGQRGRVAIKVTIPEGYDTTQIADALSGKLAAFDKQAFTLAAAGLEGRLFPDTYFFFNIDAEVDIVKILNENFEKKIAGLEAEITASGKSAEEIIIMASIIEREAKGKNDTGDDDREFISGILWKRLARGIALQADAAPVTYERRGLPDSAIANPGLLALKAAIHPKDSPYLYYLHDKEGVIHYAKTFDEHRANIAKYLR